MTSVPVVTSDADDEEMTDIAQDKPQEEEEVEEIIFKGYYASGKEVEHKVDLPTTGSLYTTREYHRKPKDKQRVQWNTRERSSKYQVKMKS